MHLVYTQQTHEVSCHMFRHSVCALPLLQRTALGGRGLALLSGNMQCFKNVFFYNKCPFHFLFVFAFLSLFLTVHIFAVLLCSSSPLRSKWHLLLTLTAYHSGPYRDLNNSVTQSVVSLVNIIAVTEHKGL